MEQSVYALNVYWEAMLKAMAENNKVEISERFNQTIGKVKERLSGEDELAEVEVTGVKKCDDLCNYITPLLARVIYGEAAGEYKKKNAMEGIGWVIRNRVADKHFPDTYTGVIYPSKQFDSVGRTLWDQAANPSSLVGRDADAYSRALTVATGVYNGSIPDPTNGALYFHSGTVPSGWFSGAIDAGRIEESQRIPPFIFYK